MSKRYFADIITQISSAFVSLDDEAFGALLDDCERAIHSGGKIVATGLGKNVPICEKFVGTMQSLGLPAAFMHTNTAMHGDLGNLRDGDLLLILSKSGSTAESVLLAEYIGNWSITLWELSFNDGGKLARMLDRRLLLRLDSEGDEWNILPNNSSSCYLILLQGLALRLADRFGVRLGDFKRNHPGGAIGAQLSGKQIQGE
jgi:arabinose-5-phosphate isomerase